MVQRSFYTYQSLWMTEAPCTSVRCHGGDKFRVTKDGTADCAGLRCQDIYRDRHDSYAQFSPTAAKRWELLARELDRLKAHQDGLVDNNPKLGLDVLLGRPARTLMLEYMFQRYPLLTIEGGNISSRQMNLPDLDIDMISRYFRENLRLTTLATVLPVLYASLHLTAWRSEFPTETERLLWRVSCLVIAASFPCLLILVLLPYCTEMVEDALCALSYRRVGNWELSFMRPLGRFRGRVPGSFRVKLSNWMKKLCQRVLWIAGAAALCAYISARVFVVVESFISLRKVPIGVYWSPPWLQMIPHL